MTWNTKPNGRPLPVTLVGFLFIAAGTFGFIYHASEVFEETQFSFETLLVLLLRILAIVIGLFLLRGANWSRWLALDWVAYHTILSAFHSSSEMITHLALVIVIALLLFLPKSSAYFKPAKE